MDVGLNGFSVVTTLLSLPSLKHTLLLLWQEPGRTEGRGVSLLFTRVGRWQVRTLERGLHIYLLSVPLLSRDWHTVPTVGTCMLIAFLDLCLLTRVPFHGKWVIQII